MKYLKRINELNNEKLTAAVVKQTFLENPDTVYQWIKDGRIDLDFEDELLFRLSIKYGKLDELKKLVELNGGQINYRPVLDFYLLQKDNIGISLITYYH
jgi:hypothetical protein